MTRYKPDEVRLNLTYHRSPAALGNRVVDMEAEHAETGEPLFRLRLSPEAFTNLMAGRNVVVNSAVAVPRGQGPDCQHDDHSSYGDCDGRVREYAVLAGEQVLGRHGGETVLLCTSHARLRRAHVVLASYAGTRP